MATMSGETAGASESLVFRSVQKGNLDDRAAGAAVRVWGLISGSFTSTSGEWSVSHTRSSDRGRRVPERGVNHLSSGAFPND